VSLSSGEAEFNGVVKGAGMALGFQALLLDLGVQAPVRVWTDSSAAIGICSRQGLGKLRHLDTHTLWIQQAVRTGRISLRKVPGVANPADLLTKHSLSRERLRDLVKLFGCEYREGRASAAPMLRRTQSDKRTMAEAETEGLTAGVNEDEELSRPVMPHKIFNEEELDKLYPAFNAPAEVDNPDATDDAQDVVLQHGWQLAGDIAKAMQTNGRTRREAWSRPGREGVSLVDLVPQSVRHGHVTEAASGNYHCCCVDDNLAHMETETANALANVSDTQMHESDLGSRSDESDIEHGVEDHEQYSVVHGKFECDTTSFSKPVVECASGHAPKGGV